MKIEHISSFSNSPEDSCINIRVIIHYNFFERFFLGNPRQKIITFTGRQYDWYDRLTMQPVTKPKLNRFLHLTWMYYTNKK